MRRPGVGASDDLAEDRVEVQESQATFEEYNEGSSVHVRAWRSGRQEAVLSVLEKRARAEWSAGLREVGLNALQSRDGSGAGIMESTDGRSS